MLHRGNTIISFLQIFLLRIGSSQTHLPAILGMVGFRLPHTNRRPWPSQSPVGKCWCLYHIPSFTTIITSELYVTPNPERPCLILNWFRLGACCNYKSQEMFAAGPIIRCLLHHLTSCKVKFACVYLPVDCLLVLKLF